MSTIWSPLDEHQRQAAREEAELKIKEYAAALASSPYVTQHKAPTLHPDWLLEWTQVSDDKVLPLLKAGVEVRYTEEPVTHWNLGIPALPNKFMETPWSALPNLTALLVLERYNGCRFLVRTE